MYLKLQQVKNFIAERTKKNRCLNEINWVFFAKVHQQIFKETIVENI